MTKKEKVILIGLLAGAGYMLYTNRDYIYFTYDNFADKITGENKMRSSTIRRFDLARQYASEKAGRDIPFIMVSAYRGDTHPLTIANPTSSHNNGSAGDVSTPNINDLKYVEYGLRKAGFTRIGINEAGKSIHADDDENKPQEITWFYDNKSNRYNTSMYYQV